MAALMVDGWVAQKAGWLVVKLVALMAAWMVAWWVDCWAGLKAVDWVGKRVVWMACR